MGIIVGANSQDPEILAILQESRRAMLREKNPAKAGATSATVKKSTKESVTVDDLIFICRSAAAAMVQEDAWTKDHMSADMYGAPSDCFADTTVARDALGWLMKFANDHYIKREAKREIGNRVAELVDSQLRIIFNDGNRTRLASINELGPVGTARAFLEVSAVLERNRRFPTLCDYGEISSMEDERIMLN
jgi:hypothetical protein